MLRLDVLMKSHKLAVSCLALSLPLAVVGCSSSGSKAATGSQNTATPTAAAASSASSPSAAASGSAGQLTGTQLAALLLQATDLPSGFAPSTGAEVDSGGSLTTNGLVKYPFPTLSCADLVNDFGQAGFGESAMAANVLANSTNGEIFEEAVYQFPTADDANNFYTELKNKWPACGTISVSDSSGDSGSFTVTPESAPSGLGQQDFAFTMKGTSSGSEIAEGSTIVLDGTDVYAINPGEQGPDVPTDLDPATLAKKLITNVSTA